MLNVCFLMTWLGVNFCMPFSFWDEILVVFFILVHCKYMYCANMNFLTISMTDEDDISCTDRT